MFDFRKIWGALFSCYLHSEIRPFASLPMNSEKLQRIFGVVSCTQRVNLSCFNLVSSVFLSVPPHNQNKTLVFMVLFLKV